MEKEIKFEDAMKQLEQIATQLESGKLNLDESVKEFENGMKLSKECSKMLEEAEKKITILIQNQEDGELKEQDFQAQ